MRNLLNKIYNFFIKEEVPIVELRIHNKFKYDNETYHIYSITENSIETYNMEKDYTRIFDPETKVKRI